MNEKMSIPQYIAIEDDDVETIIKWADKEANPLYPVPEIWDETRFREVIEIIRGN